MRRVFGAACALLAAPAFADGDCDWEAVSLYPNDAGRTGVNGAQAKAVLRLTGADEGFGGLSGLSVRPEQVLADDDGTVRRVTFDVVSDAGAAGSMSVSFDEAGAVSRVYCSGPHAIAAPDGSAFDKRSGDAEGVARLPGDDGTLRLAVTFERDHRLALVEADAQTVWRETASVRFPSRFDLSLNQSLEAVARLSDGSLLVGAETPSARATPHPVWRLAPNPAADAGFAAPGDPAFQVATEPGFGLVGLEPGPDGDLYVLRRFWTRATGNIIGLGVISADRLARALRDDDAPSIRPRQIVRLDPAEGHRVDNFEGLAVHAGPNGSTWAWMIADDNFSRRQETLLYAFEIAR